MWGHIVFLLLALRASASFCPDCVDTHRVRLSNAADRCAGVVVVNLDNFEGTICDLYWDMKDAAVVCRQVGCGAPHSAPGGSVFGTPPAMSRLMFNVNCRGDEASLLQCPYTYRPQPSCPGKRDASVHCAGPHMVRLVNGPYLCAGRVEVRHNDVWGKVCDDAWDQKDASVVCRQLGCKAVQNYRYNSRFGISPLPVMMSNVQCQGNESALWTCAQRGWNVNTCPTGRNAGVTCTGGDDTVRLVNSGDACRGRVEIKHDNRWGTVCDREWDLKDAHAVCRQLNCGSAYYAETRNDEFGSGIYPVWMSDVRCTGAERSLFDCPRAAWGVNSCSWKSDGGVQCTESRVFDPTVFKAPLSVDPKEADGTLFISSDGKELRNLNLEKERCVPLSTGVISGKRYWQVTIGSVTDSPYTSTLTYRWSLGVASESTKRRNSYTLNPNEGIWAFQERRRLNSVMDETNKEHIFIGTFHDMGIFVDYEEGLVSFYNSKTKDHIYTFTTTFQEKVYPFICLDFQRRVYLD